MWLFFMLLNVRKNPKYMFLFVGNLFLQEQRLMTTTLLLLSTFGLSGLPALHPWGEEDIFITFCDWLQTKGFCVVGTEYRVGQ
jgi:hypothetical protein